MFFGWKVVTASFFVAMFGWGFGFYGPSVYIHAVQTATGWPHTIVASSATFHFLVGSLVVAQLPRIYSNYGILRVTIAAAFLSAVGTIGWAQSSQIWQLFASAALTGAGWACLGGAALNTFVSRWFRTRRPAALAMAFNGASIGGVVFGPLWAYSISAFGFSAASVSLGALMVACVSYCALFYLRRTPAELGLALDGTVAAEMSEQHIRRTPVALKGRALWSDRRFITLCVGTAISLFAQLGLLSHLFVIFVPRVGEHMAGVILAGATASAIVGRTALGWALSDTANRRVVASANAIMQMSGTSLMLLGSHSTSLMVVGVVIFGLGIGNVATLPPLIAQREFAEEDVPRAVALNVSFCQIVYAFAPAVFGALFSIGAGGANVAENGAWAVFALTTGLQLFAAMVFASEVVMARSESRR
jgi:MFS family permease